MTKATKKVLSLLLASLLLFGLFPMPALAAETDSGGVIEPEVSATDPPSTVEAEMPIGNTEATVPETTAPVETEPSETAEPTTVPEVTHGEEVTNDTAETEPEATEGSKTPVVDLSELIIDADPPEISTYASADGQCLVLARVWNNVQELDPVTGKVNNTIRYEYPAGKSKARSFVDLHVLKVNGAWKTAYCMEPGVETAPSASYNTKIFKMEELLDSGLLSSDLTKEKVRAMGLVALYGQQKRPGQTELNAIGKMTATQILMWEIAIGWRNSSKPYARTNDAFSRRFQDKVSGVGCLMNGSQMWGTDVTGYITNVQTAYKEIAAKVEKHYLIPSFTGDERIDAPTILLLPDGKGNYTATVTDTNGILSEYTFPSVSGVTFTKSGNKLTITATKELGATLVAPTKTVPNFEEQSYYYWYDGDYQTLISCAAEPTNDPVPAYFKIQTKPNEGTGKIQKVSTNGGTVQGWWFYVWKVEDGSWNWVGKYKTNSSGIIELSLEPGRYMIREVKLSLYESEGLTVPSGVDPQYWVQDTTDKYLTITSNETATVTFTNQYKGIGKIKKVSTNGGTVAGWKFTIWRADPGQAWQAIGNYTTDANGEINVSLEPGRYAVREQSSSLPAGVDPNYWEMDTSDHIINVTAGKTSTVTVTNNYLAKAKIKKVSPNGGPIAGWRFTIWLAEPGQDWQWIGSYATDANGEINLTLDPGRYAVREQDLSTYADSGYELPAGVDPDYWECDNTMYYINVVGGKTAEVQCINNLLGKIKIQKTTNTGGNLEGWKFAVLNSSGSVVATVTTDSNGVATSGNLDPGTYYVKEVDAPSNTDGWFMDITTSGGVVCANNLLINSDFANGTKNWIGSNSTGNSVTTFDGKTVLKADPSVGKQDIGYVAQSVYRTGAGKYTLSADIYVEQDRKIYLAVWDSSSGSWSGLGTTTKNLKAGWNHVEHTFNISKDCNSIIVGIGGVKSSGAFYVYHPKFVCGDSATPWTADRTVTVTAGSTATHNVKNVKGGKIAVQKATNTGKNLDGWLFEVKDSGGKLVATLETDDTGYAVSAILAPGTYTVTEVSNSRADYNADYWELDDTVHTVIVSADSYTEVQTVEYINTFITLPGVARIVKTSTNGGTVAGWTFIIEDSTGTATEFVTDESGVIAVELEPGSYKVYEKPISDDYWIQDETVYEFTLASEEVKELPFTNRWIGEFEIVKTLLQPDDGTLDGWTFLIEKLVEADGEIIVETSFTAVTDENGLFSQFIEPGTYRITEVLEENSLWEPNCDNPQTVEIVAGEKNSVAFENRLKPGRIEITKINLQQEYLSGVKLLLEWFDESAQEWKPVVLVSESDTLTKGGCTSADLIDGTLTTGNDGVVAFEGLHPMLQYRVTELETPADYQLMADYVYVGGIPADTLEVSRTLVNFWKFVLPSVGGWDLAVIVGIAPLMAALAIMLAFIACALPCFQRQTCRMKKYNTKGKPKMKKTNRILTLLLVLCLTIGMALPAFAAETAATAIIDHTRTGSITLTKYDMTTATDEGKFLPGSFVSTGTANSAVEEALKDYAIQGVIFSYAKIADIATYSAVEGDKHITMILYAFPEGDATNALLSALGLTAADAYPNAEGEAGKLYFKSATLDAALAAKLISNSSTVKNALEQYMKSYGTEMPETSETGRSAVSGLDLGLYLLVETYVPQTVSQTTAPFFVSVPSTVDGKEWNYDLVMYPKNQTSAPNLNKTLRENKEDTGKNEGTGSITDGYAPTGTASAGDVVDYQFVSTLPTITSSATHLSCYDFFDVLSKGIEYNKGDVVIEWYTDAACTDLITSWIEADGKFTVTYGEGENNSTTMLVSMTETGLYEINNSTAVYGSDSVYQGYSDCTVRVTYACTVNSDADVVYGDAGNPNTVTLTWKRTNELYYDTLTDDAHVYTYGMELVKKFIDKAGNEVEGNFENVHFLIQNQTDGYWLVAERSEDGIYYVTDHVAEEAEATVFICDADGKIVIKGIEDDTYVITEKQSDEGFSMLEKPIEVVISASGNGEICAVCGVEGITASAIVDGDEFPMIEDNGSTNAIVTNLIVKNIAHPTIPETGDFMTWFIPAVSTVALFSGVVLLLLSNKSIRKKFSFN